MTPKLPLYCEFVTFFPSTVGYAFQRKPRQSATPMLPISFTWDGRSCCPSPQSHPSPSFLCTHFCPPSASTPHGLALHYPPVVYHISAIPYVFIHLSRLDFAVSVLLGFFLVPCSCCFPHTHVSLASLSHLTLSIKCPQSQSGICSLRRLLQVLTALQLHQHRHKGVCKPKYPSRVPRGLKLVETPWGSLVKEDSISNGETGGHSVLVYFQLTNRSCINMSGVNLPFKSNIQYLIVLIMLGVWGGVSVSVSYINFHIHM